MPGNSRAEVPLRESPSGEPGDSQKWSTEMGLGWEREIETNLAPGVSSACPVVQAVWVGDEHCHGGPGIGRADAVQAAVQG